MYGFFDSIRILYILLLTVNVWNAKEIEKGQDKNKGDYFIRPSMVGKRNQSAL